MNSILTILIFHTSPEPPYFFDSNGIIWIYKNKKTEILFCSYPFYAYYSIEDSNYYNIVIPFKDKPDSVKILYSSVFDEISYISEPVRIKSSENLRCYCEPVYQPQFPNYPPPSNLYSDITPYFKIDIFYEKNIDSLVSKINSSGYKISEEQINLLSLYLNENFRYFVIFRDTSKLYTSFYKTVIRILFSDSMGVIPMRIISSWTRDFYFFTIAAHRTKVKNFKLIYAENLNSEEINFIKEYLSVLDIYVEKNSFITSFKADSIILFLNVEKSPEDSEYQRIIYSFLYFFEPTIILIILFSFLPRLFSKLTQDNLLSFLNKLKGK